MEVVYIYFVKTVILGLKLIKTLWWHDKFVIVILTPPGQAIILQEFTPLLSHLHVAIRAFHSILGTKVSSVMQGTTRSIQEKK